MREFFSKLILYGASRRSAASIVAEAKATNLLRLVNVRYISTNIATVDFANSRDHDNTSYHSPLATRRRMALMWNGANSYFA